MFLVTDDDINKEIEILRKVTLNFNKINRWINKERFTNFIKTIDQKEPSSSPVKKINKSIFEGK